MAAHDTTVNWLEELCLLKREKHSAQSFAKKKEFELVATLRTTAVHKTTERVAYGVDNARLLKYTTQKSHTGNANVCPKASVLTACSNKLYT
ncbi:hypothetical protein NDU88_005736 [Pleurodeles waltl]|uniref:Uncharacterized protein n=1 Tax=Pleurodeles waltl TaxID=8319 RepID=A0AAV7X0F3_PLEWA|nr:hypothetical protein NDU88_005736 [Pleurodeles waltl]